MNHITYSNISQLTVCGNAVVRTGTREFLNIKCVRILCLKCKNIFTLRTHLFTHTRCVHRWGVPRNRRVRDMDSETGADSESPDSESPGRRTGTRICKMYRRTRDVQDVGHTHTHTHTRSSPVAMSATRLADVYLCLIQR